MTAQLANAITFLLFFVGLAVVYYFHDSEKIKRLFLGGLLLTVVVVNLVGIPMYPVPELHKFSHPDEPTETFYEIRVVDADDEELYLDSRAVPPAQNPHLRAHAKWMASGPESTATTQACYLLHQANEYRRSIRDQRQRGPIVPFPPHTLERHWTRSDVESTSRFTTLRIYEITVRSSADGSRTVDRSAAVVSSFTPGMEGDTCAV